MGVNFSTYLDLPSLATCQPRRHMHRGNGLTARNAADHVPRHTTLEAQRIQAQAAALTQLLQPTLEPLADAFGVAVGFVVECRGRLADALLRLVDLLHQHRRTLLRGFQLRGVVGDVLSFVRMSVKTSSARPSAAWCNFGSRVNSYIESKETAQASSAFTTFACSTPVSLKSSPCVLKVKRSWSMPSKCSTVAWKSRTWTGSFTTL